MAGPHSRGSCSITLEMVRFAVEELEKRRALVSSKMIADHLRRLYPIEQNPEELKIELKDKLDHAVSIGMLSRCRKDAYCSSTFRQEAYNYKTDFSSFWERYYRKRPGRRLRSTRLVGRRRTPSTHCPESSEDDSDSDSC
ncbi:uncharacterized protein LOC107043959 [Diachasma alloeum]|uniref:uncharacterized protein LOC107043959 n=1 Tax=Diachasma alloeum TaxID=454923 RepID=UPI0007382B78|nr:uncharacterized protein LOC107043959 [Diachasma alloeum]